MPNLLSSRILTGRVDLPPADQIHLTKLVRRLNTTELPLAEPANVTANVVKYWWKPRFYADPELPFYKLYVTDYEIIPHQVYDQLEAKAQATIHKLLEEGKLMLLDKGESISWQTYDHTSKLVIQMDKSHAMACVPMLALLKILRQGFTNQHNVRLNSIMA